MIDRNTIALVAAVTAMLVIVLVMLDRREQTPFTPGVMESTYSDYPDSHYDLGGGYQPEQKPIAHQMKTKDGTYYDDQPYDDSSYGGDDYSYDGSKK